MKNFILTVIILFLSLTSASQKTLYLSTGIITDSIEPTAPSRDITYVSDGIIVTYDFEKAIISDDPLFEGSVFWKYDGFGLNGNEGEPAVPIKSDAFIIPDGFNAPLCILETSYKDFSYTLTPARFIQLNSSEEPYSLDNVSPIGDYSGFFPTRQAMIDHADEKYRGQEVRWISVWPVQYDMKHNKVRAYTRIKYKLTFQKRLTADETPGNDKTSSSPTISPDDSFINNIAISPIQKNDEIVGANYQDTKDYLIITTPKFEEEASRLAEWKKYMGFRPHVYSQRTWTTSSVRDLIRYCYNNLPNLYYFLIIGDHNEVPPVVEYSDLICRNFATDFYYSCVDNDDTPDLYRGRIPVSSKDEATTVIDKMIYYQKYPVTDRRFYSRLIYCAFFEDQWPNENGIEDRGYVRTTELIRQYMEKYQDKQGYQLYYAEDKVNPLYWNNGLYGFGEAIPPNLKKPDFKWDSNNLEISHYINRGSFLIFHRDHGQIEQWYRPNFTIQDINNLTNSNNLPIVFSINCLTGKYNIDSDQCFARQFLCKKHGGCAGIIAATESSYSGINEIFASGLFDAVWPYPGLRIEIPNANTTAYTVFKPTYSLGQIMNQGFYRIKEAYGTSNTEIQEYTKKIYHYFGDPSMLFNTEPPTSFKDISIDRTKNVSVITSSMNSRITFIDLKSDEVTSFVGPSATYTTAFPQYVTVCISQENKIPYIDEGVDPVNTFIQNQTVTGIKIYEGNRIVIGSNVDKSQPSGDVIFNGEDITLKASSIEIHPNTVIKPGFKAIITK